MSEVRLPDGGKAWFVRSPRRLGRGGHMRPASIEGHVRTAGFALWVTGIAWFIADRELGTAGIVAAATLIVASTFLYIVTALRMSAPAGAAAGGRGSCS